MDHTKPLSVCEIYQPQENNQQSNWWQMECIQPHCKIQKIKKLVVCIRTKIKGKLKGDYSRL